MSKCILVKRGTHDCIFDIWSGQTEKRIDITVQSRASCVYITFNQADTAVIQQRGVVEEGATMHWINVTFGKKVEHALESRICGEGGVSKIDWVCLGTGSAEHRICARNIFEAPRGTGEITIYGAALDAAKIVCEGQITIMPSGDGTETSLREGVLILDPKASVRVIPSLNVRTNNVKASHAATVSRLTDDDLFYFGSRGIAHHEARQMLVEGFLGEIIKRIPDGKIQKQIEGELFKSSCPNRRVSGAPPVQDTIERERGTWGKP